MLGIAHVVKSLDLMKLGMTTRTSFIVPSHFRRKKIHHHSHFYMIRVNLFDFRKQYICIYVT